MDRTLVLVKPDGVSRGLVGEVIRRFEARMLKIRAMKLVRPPRDLWERHYEVHREKPFFPEVVDFMMSGPVVAIVLEGENAVPLVRQMMGALEPLSAQVGTIRGDLTISKRANLIHGSDSEESAEREIALWFTPGEIVD